MKKKILIILLVIFGTLQAQPEKLKIAIFDPVYTNVQLDDGTKEAIIETINAVFINAEKYIVINRALFQSATKENNILNEMQVAELGKTIEADKILTLTVLLLQEDNMLSMKMIDVKTAIVEIQKTKTVNPKNLLKSIKRLTSDLLSEIEDKEKNVPFKKNEQSEPICDCGIEIQSHDLFTEKTHWSIDMCPDGWRLPTRKELKCMCKHQPKIGNFKSNRYSNYFTNEYNRKREIYVRSFDDCEESKEDYDRELGWCRCVRDIQP